MLKHLGDLEYMFGKHNEYSPDNDEHRASQNNAPVELISFLHVSDGGKEEHDRCEYQSDYKGGFSHRIAEYR